jgi:hypothetical protein
MTGEIFIAGYDRSFAVYDPDKLSKKEWLTIWIPKITFPMRKFLNELFEQQKVPLT